MREFMNRVVEVLKGIGQSCKNFRDLFRKIFFILFILLLIGCGSIRMTGIKLSEQDLLNETAHKTISLNGLQTLDFNIGFIRGALQDDMIPQYYIDLVARLEEIAINYPSIVGENGEETPIWSEDDYVLGEAMGLKAAGIGKLTEELIDQYAPNVLTYFPSILKFL